MAENEGKQEFRVCKKCGYQRGFHVYFKEMSEGNMRIGLICPSCGQSYDVGWVTSDVSSIEPEEGDSYGEKRP
ncbi:hypothetical protein V7O66_06165 [Methanolobus sp. ZRKC3]|uniref:hypothetical protein n=1 Tax=Methanolobus sp. ZRKC3 TaxID=3125786 RepID=UPI003246F87D